MTITFQATGEEHKVRAKAHYYDGDYYWLTMCGQKCLPIAPIGKMPVEPPKTKCKDCYGD